MFWPKVDKHGAQNVSVNWVVGRVDERRREEGRAVACGNMSEEANLPGQPEPDRGSEAAKTKVGAVLPVADHLRPPHVEVAASAVHLRERIRRPGAQFHVGGSQSRWVCA